MTTVSCSYGYVLSFSLVSRIPSVQMGLQECVGDEIRGGKLQEGEDSAGYHVE